MFVRYRKLVLSYHPWQKEDDRLTGSISRIQLTGFKTINTSLINYLHDSCLTGEAFRPTWRGDFKAEKSGTSIHLRFGIRCRFPATGAASDDMARPAATMSIIANDLSALTGQVSVYGKDYTSLIPSKGVRNDCPYFELASRPVAHPTEDTRGDGFAHSGLWLITAGPDDLPYTLLSRRDYLEQVKASLGVNKETIIKGIKAKDQVRSQDDQNAEKEKAINALRSTYTGSELEMRKRRYLEQFKSDEDILKEDIDNQTAGIDSTVSFIDGMLHRLSPATLAAPAVVPAKATEFEGFADGEEGAVQLIQPKAIFIEQGSGPEKPRFFVLSLNYDPTDHSTDLGQQIAKRLDTRFIKKMLKN
ncbi:hypothetical protein ACQ86N_12350 [Puia sp. P3]|uniref:hypothetical protein n=1 Tax=Puia sp. P3 TaxID=3423952 RepID=UPI003D67EEFC